MTGPPVVGAMLFSGWMSAVHAYKNYTSSILNSFHPSNCMMILCN